MKTSTEPNRILKLFKDCLDLKIIFFVIMEQNNEWRGINLNMLSKERVSVFLSSIWHQEWWQIYDNVFTERRCMKWKSKAVNDILMDSQGFICCSESFHTFSPIYRKHASTECHQSSLPLSPSSVVFTSQMIICTSVPLGMFEHSSLSLLFTKPASII